MITPTQRSPVERGRESAPLDARLDDIGWGLLFMLTSLLGGLALAAGVGELVGVELPLAAIVLIPVGGGILLRLALERRS